MKVDIHNYERRLRYALDEIKASEMLDENKKLLIDFYSYLSARGLSIARTEHYMQHIKVASNLISKPFNVTTKTDVLDLLESVRKSKSWSERTLADFKLTLKVFFKWLRQSDGYPEEVAWLKISKGSKRRLPEEIITEEEVKAMAERADNPRDRAFVLALYESGCRVGEMLPLRIKNVQLTQHGTALNVNGKTGGRRVLIISSAPALASWLNVHPYKDCPDAFVWLGIGNRNKNESLRYHAAIMFLKKLAQLAGIKKKVNPHSFRHARATHLANVLTEAQMKQYFGWVQGSDMASIYVHLSGRDVDNALLKLHGLAQNERKEEDILKLKICPKCQEKNDPVSKFCRRCGSALDIKIAMELENEILKKDEVVAEVVKRLVEKLNLEKEVYEVIKELKLEKEFERK